MIRPDITARRIGREGQPIAIIDGFHPDPDILRAHAVAQQFTPALNHYPGIRATLPPDYFEAIRPALTAVIAGVFAHRGGMGLIDASYSMVTTAPDRLTLPQRLPHMDSVELGRIALVHYLSPDHRGGTAFYRHRATGFEAIEAERAPAYLERLNGELQDAAPPPPAYLNGSTPLFEQADAVEARYNRAVIYRSALLHSGAIPADATLSDDPSRGRLTVTAFLTLT